MRILIAGATRAIGRPLVRCLKEGRHAVFALARSPQSSRVVAELGAEPVTADARDAASVKAAVTLVRPDAVVNELTALPRHYTAVEMKAAAERDRKIRIEGNANLLAALQESSGAATCCKARDSGTRQARASLMRWRSLPLLLRQGSLRAHTHMPNLKQRH
jgi:nucleoside-diphosphate-sugar epimerase